MARSGLISKKRIQIEKAQAIMFGSIIAASIVVSFSIVTVNFLWKRKQFNDEVIAKKTEVLDTLKQNVENAKVIQTSYIALEQNERVNSRTVLSALPSKYDFPALTTSIESLVARSSVKFDSFSGTDESISTKDSATADEPYPMKFTLTISGTYGNIQDFIRKLEKTIRPMQIDTATIAGADDSITVDLTVTTYFLPGKTLNITKETVQ